MHAAMLRGELEPRYLVAVGHNGLADSVIAAVSLLFVAILQKRALFLSFASSAMSAGAYEWALRSPNGGINWTW